MANNQTALTLTSFGLTTVNPEEWYNSFLVRVSSGDSIMEELQVSRVEARFSAMEIRNMSQPLVIAALAKVINETFTYFAQDKNPELIALIVDDLRDHCKRMSPVEIIKAIREGRRLQGDLYGKLSAKNFMYWISEYEGKAGEDIAQHHQNQKIENAKKLDLMVDALPGELRDNFKYIGSEDKREFTHAEKLQALKDQDISDTEKQRREYGRKWTTEMGDFKTYMDNYDSQETTN